MTQLKCWECKHVTMCYSKFNGRVCSKSKLITRVGLCARGILNELGKFRLITSAMNLHLCRGWCCSQKMTSSNKSHGMTANFKDSYLPWPLVTWLFTLSLSWKLTNTWVLNSLSWWHNNLDLLCTECCVMNVIQVICKWKWWKTFGDKGQRAWIHCIFKYEGLVCKKVWASTKS